MVEGKIIARASGICTFWEGCACGQLAQGVIYELGACSPYFRVNWWLRRVHRMDDDELIGLDRRCRVFYSLIQQAGEFLGWVALIILTEGNCSAATSIVGSADDLFPPSQVSIQALDLFLMQGMIVLDTETLL